MRSKSTNVLLLGIALLLFGLAFPTTLGSLIAPYIPGLATSPTLGYLVATIFPVAGLIVAFVGFFTRSDQ